MSLARNLTPPTQDAPVSQPEQRQKANTPAVYNIAGRSVQQPRGLSGTLAAILSRGLRVSLAVRNSCATFSISGKAVATSCAVGLGLLAGFVAYAYRRPASPLASGALLLNQNVKQNVPFGPVTITPSAAPNAGSAAPSTASPAPRPAIPKPSAARRAAKLRWRPRQDASTANLNQQSDIQ